VNAKDLPPLTVLSPEEELVAFAALELALTGRSSRNTLQRPSYRMVLAQLYARLQVTVEARLSCDRFQEMSTLATAAGWKCPRCGKPYDGTADVRCWCT
jgi:ubiquitin C-terminal hydrolase